jgi:signal transduction histidine kinase/CheY-like chemotaxis protein/HPt (histidine-containing phosphotransfer) domain-containing protein
MAVAGIDGVILVGNSSFNRLFHSLRGSADTEAAGSSFDFLSVYDLVRLANLLSKLSSGAAKNVDFRTPFRDSQGHIHWFNLKGWLISEDVTQPPDSAEWRGPLIGIIIDDETRKRENEEKLLADNHTAEQAMEAKSRFLATMSHEIRTPIQTIIGMAELLQDTKLNHEQAEYVRQEKFSAEVLLALINDILDYSKIEAGKMELERVEFDLAEVVEQAVQMISMEAHKKDLEIAAAIPPETRIRITGDPGKFRQVVINLVKNAVKFTSRGSVVVSVSIYGNDENGKNITVRVADTGIGIPEESRARLFSSFVQADASHSRRFGGTGLGLAISRSIVELMGGTIGIEPNVEFDRRAGGTGEDSSLESESGGSVFFFTVPLETPPGGDVPPLPGLSETETRFRVLLVDDSAVSRRVISSYLKDLGFDRVETASSGEEALVLLRAAAEADDPCGLCFIDMNMAPMDGWRLAAEIKDDSAISGMRLALMIPQGRLEGEAKMFLLKWFNGYVNKPVTLRGLYETAAAALAEPETLMAVVVEESATPEIPSGDAARDSLPDAAPPGEFAALTVLVAEDHEVNRKLFDVILGKLGVTVILAEDGLECLEKAAARPVDMILMDLQMPRMNGFEAAAELRGRGFDKPIIALTAGVLDDEQNRCIESGFDDILLKPCKKPDIEAVLKKWRGKTRAGAVFPVSGGETGRQTEKTNAPNGGVFNAKKLRETFMNDEANARFLLEKFMRRCGEQIESFSAIDRDGNREDGRRIAHNLKGSALTLSGEELGEAAARLERAYKSDDWEAVQAAREVLGEAFGRFGEAAEAYLNNHQ